jgi:regulator of RNase E activity RraB
VKKEKKMNIFNRRFIDEKKYKLALEKQAVSDKATISQLQKHNVNPTTKYKVEYFFYSNTLEKVQNLAKELNDLKYEVRVGKSAEGNLYIARGLTSEMQMEDLIIRTWTTKMIEIGYKHDCEFDGWGVELN